MERPPVLLLYTPYVESTA